MGMEKEGNADKHVHTVSKVAFPMHKDSELQHMYIYYITQLRI